MNRLRYLVASLMSLVLVGVALGQADPGPRLIIDIDSQGVISVTPDDSAEKLDERATREHVLSALGRDPKAPVLIRSDIRASLDSVSRVIMWLHEHGAEKIGILADGDELWP